MSRLFDDALSEYLEKNAAPVTAYPFAMACWFRANVDTLSLCLMWCGNKDEVDEFVALFAKGNVEGDIIRAYTNKYGEVEEYHRADTSSGFTVNTWHHAAGMWLSRSECHSYIDGGNKGTDTNEVAAMVNHDRVAIGAMRDSTPGEYHSDKIAEIAIWDLTDWGGNDAERETNFEAALVDLAAGERPSSYPTGLVAYWSFKTSSLEDEVGEFDLTASGTTFSTDHPPMFVPISGSAAGVSVVSGFFALELQSSTAGISGVSGLLDSQSGLGSSAAGISVVDGSLNVETNLQGSAAGISVVSGIFSFRLAGSTAGVSGADGVLDLQPGLGSSAVGVSNISGLLDSQPGLGSSIVEISGASAFLGQLGVIRLFTAITVGPSGIDGSLSIVTKLQSSVSGTSDVNGVFSFRLVGSIAGASATLGLLEVLTSLVGSLVGASGKVASLNVLTPLISSVAGISGEVASLDSQPGCEGSAAGVSVVSGFLNIIRGLFVLYGSAGGTTILSGYLTLIPDFEAATLFWRPQDNILETLEWNTSILKSHNGTEQRIKVRQSPRQYFKLQLVLDLNSENDEINTWFDSVLHTWQKQAWLIPIWTEYVKHTSNITIKADFIDVDTTFADFRNSNKAIIWKSSTEYEVIVISTKTDSRLNLSYSILNSYTGDKYIIPIRTAYLVSSSRKQKTNSPVSIVDLVFAVYDNINITDYSVENDYDFLTLLSTPAYMDSVHLENSDGDIIITDFETGIFKVESDSDFNFLSQNHVFFNDTKEECWKFRQFLHSLNGRQKTVLIPTFRDDVVQAAIIEDFEAFVDIDNIKLADNMGFNSLRTYIGFYFPNGTFIVRKITDITEIDSSIERISFNNVLDYGSLIELGDCKICFVDKCRLASDKVEIFWPDTHKNECRTNFMRIK